MWARTILISRKTTIRASIGGHLEDVALNVGESYRVLGCSKGRVRVLFDDGKRDSSSTGAEV